VQARLKREMGDMGNVASFLGVRARGAVTVCGEDGADRAVPRRRERSARSERATVTTSRARCV
jgi:hypothetical protein